MIDAALAPPPLPSILPPPPPQFNIGDRVHTIPDSRPGVNHLQAEAFYGSVFELKFDRMWYYTIQSIHSLRNFIMVPEARGLPMSISISDGGLIATRDNPVQQQLSVVKKQNAKLKENCSGMKAFFKLGHLPFYPIGLEVYTFP